MKQSTGWRVQPFSPSSRRSRRMSVAICKSTAVSTDARQQILQTLREPVRGGHPQREERLAAATKQLLSSQKPEKGALKSMQVGKSTWQVYSAPHIEKMSAVLGTLFSPIQYRLDGNQIISHVKYSSPLFKEGWLSASGSISAASEDTLKIVFDDFWLDRGSTALRRDGPSRGGSKASSLDKLVSAFGRLGFIAQLSFFPVLYVDDELAIFSFPPLRSNIAIFKIQN